MAHIINRLVNSVFSVKYWGDSKLINSDGGRRLWYNISSSIDSYDFAYLIVIGSKKFSDTL